ncbi:GntR family transcriptional regulator [Cuneatibacter sp. NSJ-177]|jgi:GntR family transcriptional regulator|uniref:GntR family transcriptional regulator n=1 Tax=Cuneatibacter sp. NSJ-177 TaxID=2931401 RepID=UPI001FD239BC|nr:GntR family transcriptional regulator [Cuneatibacter sp. NSJ-177]MCJ7837276.1 GntR family transcriptional regulator [Cuneatibacter sp. NSJ-177]
MFQIDVMSRKPVYEQLVNQVERFILIGVIHQDEQIPSVRSLSVELAVNPNTIQKAYSELDRRGITYSVPGKGSFVAPGAVQRIGERRRSKLKEFIALVSELALAGIKKEEIIACVEEAYREKEAVQ